MMTDFGLLYRKLCSIVLNIWYLLFIFIFASILLIQEMVSYKRSKELFHLLYAKGFIFIGISGLLAIILTLKITPSRNILGLSILLLIVVCITISFYIFWKAKRLQKKTQDRF